MNIFVLSYRPRDAARDHCDKHVVKMILETAQLLSTAHRELDDVPKDSPLYKSTHKNHPCAKWVRECSANYFWAYSLFDHLNREYTARYGKTHMSWVKLGQALSFSPRNIPVAANTTQFPLAMPIQYIHPGSEVLSYRNYYMGAKRDIAVWKDPKTKPGWFV